MMKQLLEKTAEALTNGTGTITSRVLTIWLALCALVSAPFAYDGYTSLKELKAMVQAQAIEQATTKAREEGRDSRIAALEAENKRQDLLIYDHERRIYRLEGSAN